ncbi:hypothetical protein OPV22_017400 [Ensete ventricosum]|uniref:Uncharacterized protein n=1 Tax=Ensete ventricosum TaxID=4639 RepID=A0AAV8PF68_ENSVE|nr:hypothetical protein OPV22_017400 [Ensete ventricosum]
MPPLLPHLRILNVAFSPAGRSPLLTCLCRRGTAHGGEGVQPSLFLLTINSRFTRTTPPTQTRPSFPVSLSTSDGEAQHQAVLGELLHNEREREAEEEGAAPEPGEPGTLVRAETEAGQIQRQLQDQ